MRIGVVSALLALNVAVAAEPAPPVSESPVSFPHAAIAEVSNGDEAWFEGNRKDAVSAYRSALASDSHAAKAMAGLRLLHLTGNLSMARLGPQIDAALAECTEGAWCLLAHADFHIWAPPEVGASRIRALDYAQRAEEALPGPAAARIWMATGENTALLAMKANQTDGLGTGFVANGGAPPPSPGTWFIGVGLIGAPGIGYGGGVRYTQPDLFRKGARLHAEMSGTTAGNGGGAVYLRTGGEHAVLMGLQASRTPLNTYDADTAALLNSELVDSFTTWAGLTAAPKPHWASIRLIERTDVVDDTAMRAPTVELSMGWENRKGWGATRSGYSLYASTQYALEQFGADYPFTSGRMRAIGYKPVKGFVVAARGHLESVNSDAPYFRHPVVGGADLLRGAPYGRYRSTAIAAADVELRRMITGPVEGVVFIAGALVHEAGAHPTAGFGFRLLLPPDRTNGLRMDIGFSADGWALASGWQETF